MSTNLEELDYQQTAFGELILRRRRFPSLGDLDVFEVILNDEFLMSSLFTAGEIALAKLALQSCESSDLDILVGGLGLGYTAASALEDPRVRSLTVIDALPAVVSWHQQSLLPMSRQLTEDPRCSFITGNFFELADNAFRTITPGANENGYHIVLLDVDHSPAHVLQPQHRTFYTATGLRNLRNSMRPAGVFALWSNDAPDHAFTNVLDEVFANYMAHSVAIPNPLTEIEGSNTIYLATT